MERNRLVIAIDGPAASGKSTTAKLVAQQLGYTYIDTGAMYRAVTLAALRNGVDPANREEVEKLAFHLSIRFQPQADGSLRTILNEEDVSREIRSQEVTKSVSAVSAWHGVREAMVQLQREMSKEGGVVMDGRDIGTVVFPDAEVKVFMVADIQARAQRRQVELVGNGKEMLVEDVVTDIERRDQLDSSREESPLRKADDAVEIDTSSLTIEEQVAIVLNLAQNVREKRISD
ncbi:MAG: (d)CMP kinase [Ignavibacteriae bacterium]|nr:(d)CMP kinase [Ignavibacteriota bacterium]MCB9215636.1 (d)CMP kinase [Ignavibacteria bacterium]